MNQMDLEQLKQSAQVMVSEQREITSMLSKSIDVFMVELLKKIIGIL